MTDTAVNFRDAEVQRNRFAAYEAARALGAVYKDPGSGIYMIFDHDLSRTLLRDTETLSSQAGQVMVVERPYQAKLNAITEEHGYKPIPALSFADPPAHTWQRALVEQSFTIPRIRAMEAYLRQVTNEVIDTFINEREIDFFRRMANIVPCMVISDQIGLPRSEIETFKCWVGAFVEQADQGLTEERDIAIAHILCEMQRYLASKAEFYQREPAPCMLSDLANAKIGDGHLDIPELVTLGTILLVAGIGTTRSALTSAVYHIATTEGLEEELRNDPAKIAPFVEEVLRLESPVQAVFRKAKRDLEVEGVTIPAGATVAISLAAANRDASAFKCPAELHIDRNNLGRQLAFGHGPHHCVGKELGRAEVTISLQSILNRMRNIKLARGAESMGRPLHFFQHTYSKLWISFEPA